MWLAVLAMSAIALMLGALLGWAARRLPPETDSLTRRIDALLPQTQCAQCGYPGCRPYAQAIADGAADINQCPPGGDETIRRLADLLGAQPKPLNRDFGASASKQVALIKEQDCVGCALCLAACPVDAIIGAPRYMHTVLTSDCTGCELCVPVCPVDCITMQPVALAARDWHWPLPQQKAA